MDKPSIVASDIRTLGDGRFIKLYDLAYEDGSHYIEASRRDRDDLLVLRDDDELKQALPDAVSCCVVIDSPEGEPLMVLNREYRYPTGQYVLSVPSGLIDSRDLQLDAPLEVAMTREIAEECGIVLGEEDSICVINPCLFTSPGLTDESTALLCAVIRSVGPEGLSQKGAEGTERFDGFVLLTEAEAWDLIRTGRDSDGQFYPLIAWALLMWFATGSWRTLIAE